MPDPETCCDLLLVLTASLRCLRTAAVRNDLDGASADLIYSGRCSRRRLTVHLRGFADSRGTPSDTMTMSCPGEGP
jgi:hypothetical protein